MCMEGAFWVVVKVLPSMVLCLVVSALVNQKQGALLNTDSQVLITTDISEVSHSLVSFLLLGLFTHPRPVH